MDLLWKLVNFSFIPAIIMLLAGGAATIRVPGLNLRSAVLHFAAGVVFAVVSAEFIPDLVHEHKIATTAIGFTIGTALMLAIRSWTSRAESDEKEQSGRLPSGFLMATGIDLAIDGLMLGIGFAAGAKEGILLTVALTIELLSLGIATTANLTGKRIPQRKTLLVLAGLSLLFVLSAVTGGLLSQAFTGVALAGLIAFGTAALLFLVTEELLTEAHEIEESPLLTATFFAGFLMIFLLEMLTK
ncbi:putative membrane protein (plasmid) [Leptolyngbya sp. NIES-3755]|nr:putative membrane protein [Leptolyngbya sp. NIES-3755]